MTVQTKPITASQFASATMHLELRDDPEERWQTVRIDGIRYISLTSGTSWRRHFVRADANGCDCVWYQRTGRRCSHMLAVEIDAMEQELAEAPLMADLYRRCARVGCGAICEGTTLCDACSALQERSERMAAARARVIEEWAS